MACGSSISPGGQQIRGVARRLGGGVFPHSDVRGYRSVAMGDCSQTGLNKEVDPQGGSVGRSVLVCGGETHTVS